MLCDSRFLLEHYRQFPKSRMPWTDILRTSGVFPLLPLNAVEDRQKNIKKSRVFELKCEHFAFWQWFGYRKRHQINNSDAVKSKNKTSEGKREIDSVNIHFDGILPFTFKVNKKVEHLEPFLDFKDIILLLLFLLSVHPCVITK